MYTAMFLVMSLVILALPPGITLLVAQTTGSAVAAVACGALALLILGHFGRPGNS